MPGPGTDRTFHAAASLLATVVKRYEAGGEVCFIVGWPVAAPAVRSVGEMLTEAESKLGARASEVDGKSEAERYQSAMSLLAATGGGGRQAVDGLVRGAVLRAWTGDDPGLPEGMGVEDQKRRRRLTRLLEERESDWQIPPAAEYLGRILARFSAQCGRLLTTNFDPLIEVAVRRAGGDPQSLSLGADRPVETESRHAPLILHVHGDWRGDEATRHSELVVRERRAELEQSLASWLAQGSLVVAVAYGGWDDVLMRALAAACRRHRSAAEVCWSFYSADSDEIRRQHSAVLDLLPSSASLYKGVDCHRFFPELWAALSSATPFALTEARRAYRRWAASEHTRMPLLGFGQGREGLPFDQVFVRLSFEAQEALHGAAGESPGGPEPVWSRESANVETLFAQVPGGARHRALLGAPGSGKSTVLQKLFRLALDRPQAVEGLAAEAVPLFVRLSGVTAADLAGEPRDAAATTLLRRLAVDQVRRSGCRLEGQSIDKDHFGALTERGSLLLLLDGFDELPSGEARARFARLLHAAADSGEVRIALTSRREGYLEDLDLLGRRFARFEVRPLDQGGIEALAERWFEAAEAAGLPVVAGFSRERFLETLRVGAEDPLHELLGSPMLLTLLCLSVALGGELPRRRASFLASGLRLLLGGWDRAGGKKAPPVDTDLALALLRELAGEMFRGGASEVDEDDLAARLATGLDRRGGEGNAAAGVLEWLRTDANVLQTLGPGRYGFRHQSFLDYLAACDLAARGTAAVGDALRSALAGEEHRRRGGRETVRLLAGLPEYRGLALLVPALLELDAELADDGSRDLLGRCLEEAFDLEPAMLYRLLGLDDAGGRAESFPPLRLGRALRLLERRAGPALAEPLDRLLGSLPRGREHEVQRAQAEELRRRAVGPDAEPAAPERGPAVVERRPGSGVPRLGEPFTEPASGERFLWVPGGTFTLGDRRLGGLPGSEERPGVEVRPFWLAETPVTNRQYGRFVAEGKGREPEYWRDERFSNPRQPVVGVSWEDASAYCEWLGRESGLSGRGFRVGLPAEAEWEFAARGGGEQRLYPWGDRPPPDETRACFDLDVSSGSPAPVGSYPAGKARWGHLDLAGGVWEWCRDRIEEHGLDVWKKEVVRALRGGSWALPAEYLRSAFRFRFPAGYRHRAFGFRVAVVPASR